MLLSVHVAMSLLMLLSTVTLHYKMLLLFILFSVPVEREKEGLPQN